jgi:DNA (cytosine-5)-methyltransferase 1
VGGNTKLYLAQGTDAPWYKGWAITDSKRDIFRATTLASQEAKRKALRGECDQPKHPINEPKLDTNVLMPSVRRNGLAALSLFSGGGGMDIGFDHAGFNHVGSYELMEAAARVLKSANPKWSVFAGADGDVNNVDWSKYRGKIDVLHGGPPCQPFSHAGRQNGPGDVRDMIPSLVSAVTAVRPSVFICENVSGLASQKFKPYVQANIFEPLRRSYTIHSFVLDAADFGVPQRRRRMFFVGFSDPKAGHRFEPPKPTHSASRFYGTLNPSGLPHTMGAREALGLADIGKDGLAPTIRSGLTGPRHTTSIVSSVSALRTWNELEIWPNGVAATREAASAYVAKNGHFRLSIPDCLTLQGFPQHYPIGGPVYFALGLIGNSVAPPMSYRLALAIARALKQSRS